MIKFHCGQCGHRIAIQKRQLGKRIVCPDCGDDTHPVAEQVIKRRAVAAKKARVETAGAPPACANCAQVIGRLQKLHLWENKVVCGECHRKLSIEHQPDNRLSTQAVVTPVAVTRSRPIRRPQDEADPLVQNLIRPFRGGLFGALVGLCVAGAALYGTLSLLRDVAGLITGLAIGGIALLLIYLLLRTMLGVNRAASSTPARRIGATDRRP